MRVGLTYDQALDIPFGELMDYVAIEQIKHEGARFQDTASEADEFFALLSRR